VAQTVFPYAGKHIGRRTEPGVSTDDCTPGRAALGASIHM